MTSTDVPRTRTRADAARPARSQRSAFVASLRNRRIDVLLLVGLVGLALVLRIGPLGPSSLWLDDAWIAFAHRAETFTELRYVGFSAPGFAVLLRVWLATVGFDEPTAQLLPLAAGVAAPALAYLVGRRFGLRLVSALLVGLLLATSPIAVDYATRVKPYTLESVLALVLLGLADHLLRDVRSRGRWVMLFVVGVIATTFSAFLAPYVGAALAAGVLTAWRGHHGVVLRRGLVLSAVYGLLATAWYVTVLAPALTSSISGFWSDHYLVTDAGLSAFVTSMGDAVVGLASGLSVVPPELLLVGLGLATVLVGLADVERAALLLTPLIVAVVLAAFALAPLGGGRTDLYLYPSMMLLLGYGADRLLSAGERGVARGRSRSFSTAAVAVVVVACTVLIVTAEPASPYPRYDVRPLAAVLESRAAENDAVVVYPATMWAYALYTEGEVQLEADTTSAWGFAPRFADPRIHVLPPGRDDPSAYLPTVRHVAGESDRVWLLASHWREDYDALQAQFDEAGFERVELEHRDGAQLSRWQRR